MKVLTALAARLELGADFRFATDIQAQPGAKQGDAINGDIWINFVGDPTLSRMDLLALFKQLGVNRIKGNVYVNTGAYNGYERGNGWSWDQTLCFAAPVSSVIIDKNCAYGTITATQIGKPAVGNVATGVPIGIGADNVEVMSYGDMARQFCALEVDMAKGNFYELKGCITPNKDPQGLRFAIHDVEAWGWDNIRWAMDRAGIKHDGLLRVTHKSPDNAETLGTHYSVSLPVMLAKMLKKSDNLYADTFLKTVGRHYYNKPGSYRSGTMAVRAILTKNGIDLGNATLADGSGLSAHNLISARQMLSVLNFIQKMTRNLASSSCCQAPRWMAPWPGGAASPPHDEEQGARQDRHLQPGGLHRHRRRPAQGLRDVPARPVAGSGDPRALPRQQGRLALDRVREGSAGEHLSAAADPDRRSGLICRKVIDDDGRRSAPYRRWRTAVSTISTLTSHEAGLSCPQPHMNGERTCLQ